MPKPVGIEGALKQTQYVAVLGSKIPIARPNKARYIACYRGFGGCGTLVRVRVYKRVHRGARKLRLVLIFGKPKPHDAQHNLRSLRELWRTNRVKIKGDVQLLAKRLDGLASVDTRCTAFRSLWGGALSKSGVKARPAAA